MPELAYTVHESAIYVAWENGQYCRPWWPDYRACTPALLKLWMLHYWSVAEEGRPELWRERSLGSSVKQKNAGLERSRILHCETWNTDEGFWELFCWNSIYLSLHEITRFLFCHSQNSNPNPVFSESLSVSDSDRMPWDYYCINVWTSWCSAKNKGLNRIKWFYWLCGVNWPLSNQANKLSHCSGVRLCEALNELLLTNWIYSQPSQ